MRPSPIGTRGVVSYNAADGAGAGTLVGVDGTPYRLLRVAGVALDALATGDQDRHAYLLGALAAGLPSKARLSIFVENRAADAATITADLRAQLAPTPYIPALGELGDRLIAWWGQRLSAQAGARHVAHLDYWLLVAPYPVPQGEPDQPLTVRLSRAESAVTRQLVAMGLPPLSVDEDTARAFLARHLTPNGDGAGYVALVGDETMHTYRIVDPATGRERWIRTLYLVAPPPTTTPGWLRSLVAMECPATLILHVRGLNRSWERRRQGWRLRLMEGTSAGSKDITTALAAGDATATATALHTTGYGIVKVSCYIQLEGNTRAQLDSRVGRVLDAMRDTMLAEVGYGHAHQEPAYHATLPGYGDPGRSVYRLDSTTIGNSWPFLAFNPGTKSAGVPLGVTDAAGDVVSLALDDPNLYNRIGVVLGRVGTGKTSLLQKLALWFLLRGDMATMVSSVDSFGALCEVSGGERATLGGAHTATINVWDGDRTTDEERRERVRFVCAAVDLLLGGLADLEPAYIDEAVRDIYAGGGETTPTMGDLYAYLEGKWTTKGGDRDEKKVWRALGWRLRPYVRDGQHAALVDGQTTVRLDAPLLAFDTSPLEDNAALRNYAYFATFAIVDARKALARARSAQAGRASADHLLGLDESWALLKSPLARDYINRTSRKARHGGSCVVFASQQIKDLIGDTDAETFFTQASFKALFSVEDNGAQTEGNPKLWLERMLQLTPEEVEAAQRMSGEKGVYMPMFLTRRDRGSARDLHGIVRVELTSDEAYLFASDTDDLAARAWWTEKAGSLWAGIKARVDSDAGEEVAV